MCDSDSVQPFVCSLIIVLSLIVRRSIWLLSLPVNRIFKLLPIERICCKKRHLDSLKSHLMYQCNIFAIKMLFRIHLESSPAVIRVNWFHCQEEDHLWALAKPDYQVISVVERWQIWQALLPCTKVTRYSAQIVTSPPSSVHGQDFNWFSRESSPGSCKNRREVLSRSDVQESAICWDLA